VRDWQATLEVKGRQSDVSDLTAHLRGDKLSALGQLVAVLRDRILDEQAPVSTANNPGGSKVQSDHTRLSQKWQRPLNALIVGASSGIGAALAKRLSTRGSHISLCLVGRRLAPLDAVAEACRRQGAKVSVVAGDATSEADVARISSNFADTMQNSTALPVVVCNAGVGAPGPTAEISAAACSAVLGTNVTGVMLTLREVLPLLSRAPTSQIVVTGSVLGLRSPSSGGNVVYTASKHAVEGVVDAVRNEFAGSGVKIGVVNPGGVRTEWFDDPRKGGYSNENKPDTSSFLHVEEVVDALLAVIDQDATTDIRRIVVENHVPR
jgi:short-subunit dehydrogenase